MVNNNRQSPISFAPGENRAQELICFAQCRSSVRFVSQIRQTPRWWSGGRAETTRAVAGRLQSAMLTDSVRTSSPCRVSVQVMTSKVTTDQLRRACTEEGVRLTKDATHVLVKYHVAAVGRGRWLAGPVLKSMSPDRITRRTSHVSM